MPAKPTRTNMTSLRQICELIPAHLVPTFAREHGVDARKFSAWGQVISHVHGQLTHAVGLNDICDGLALNTSRLRVGARKSSPASRAKY